MAELFGKATGCSGGRGGSMHLFDLERRFLGGYGIVGGNLPLAAGVALASDYTEHRGRDALHVRRRRHQPGHLRRDDEPRGAVDLPVVFMVINNQFGMGTALERHSAVTDLSRKSDGFGVPGTRCDGMDVLDVHACVSEALEKARGDRKPQLVEAVTYRYRGHSMADPEEYRTKEEVEEWRGRDPIATFSKRVTDEGVLSEDDVKRLDDEAMERVDDAVEFADESPFPDLASLYDDVYVIGEQVPAAVVVHRLALARHPPRRGGARGRRDRARAGREGRAARAGDRGGRSARRAARGEGG